MLFCGLSDLYGVCNVGGLGGPCDLCTRREFGCLAIFVLMKD